MSKRMDLQRVYICLPMQHCYLRDLTPPENDGKETGVRNCIKWVNKKEDQPSLYRMSFMGGVYPLAGACFINVPYPDFAAFSKL